MALWDSADLLARCQRDSGTKAIPDEAVASPDWFAFLTEAQDQLTRMISAIFPAALATDPVQLSSTDGGLTYEFPTAPMALLEVTSGKGGYPLTFGAFYSGGNDLVWEGELTLRMARNTARSFGAGLWVRYIPQPGAIDDTTEPTLPKQYRPPLVPLACYRYASQGGFRDPQPYLERFNWLWSGNPGIQGDTGLLGALRKKQATQIGPSQAIPWYRVTGDIFGG